MVETSRYVFVRRFPTSFDTDDALDIGKHVSSHIAHLIESGAILACRNGIRGTILAAQNERW